MPPALASVNVVAAEPSPQSTLTAHGPSSPGSVNEPRLNDFDVPSSAVWSAAAVTTGATFATVTLKLFSSDGVGAVPASDTFTLTVYTPSSAYVCDFAVIGPGAASVKVVAVEPSPQSTVTAQGPSSPGSVNEPRLNDFDVPSLAVWSAAAVTTGTTFATCSLKLL